jgi:anti-sigma regulatory factor (Ser/Thr protein kinase)
MGAVLIPRHPQQHFALSHSSDIASVRRQARQLTDLMGFSETRAGHAAIVVTELATNILKHAEHGTLVLTPVVTHGQNALEILALDKGKGIPNLSQSLRDGISTAGTPGNGLGAIRRLSQEFDAYSADGKGAVFYSCVVNDGAPVTVPGAPDEHRLRYGAICVPVAGEEECGDAWAIYGGNDTSDSLTMVVADGLGHGPDAAVASMAAIATFAALPGLEPAQLIEKMHLAMRSTRGAAVAIGKLSPVSGAIRFVGIGNISATIVDQGVRKQLVSHNGIVGNNMRKVQEFEQAWPPGALCIMCSDGISTQWDLSAYPGLEYCHPSLVAAILFRDFARGRDDATVLAVRYNERPA